MINIHDAKIKRSKITVFQASLLSIALSLCLLPSQVTARTPSALCNTLATYDEGAGTPYGRIVVTPKE